MLNNIKTNWAAMTDSQRRKVIVVVVGVIAFIILFLSMPSRNSGIKSGNQPAKSVNGSVNLQSSPDNEWLDRAMKNSAARHRVKLKEEIDTLSKKIISYQSGTTKDLGEIKTSIKALTTATKEWELEVARERAQRKAADKLIISQMGVGGVPSLNIGEDGVVVEEQGASLASGVLNIATQSNGDSEKSTIKVSAFDMGRIARMNRLSLASSQSTGVRDPNVDSLKPKNIKENAEKNVANNPNSRRNSPTNQQIDRNGNVGSGEVQLSSNNDVKSKKALAKIPTGSIIQARLVTGLNAVIANTADSDKLIVLAKLTDPILFPNNKKVSLRGCTLMGSGKGDISTERVYINTTILSCIDHDDVLYEGTVMSNAIGEDGVLGLRGRPVTKDGALLMQSVGTGLIQGFASAFSNASQQPQIVSNSDGGYTLPPVDYVGKSALAGGVDKGLEQMVKRANGLLDQIFPVLEIDAGRSIEFIVQQSFELREI